MKRSETDGAKTMAKLARISQKKQDEEIRRSLKLGLTAADSVIDRNISLFARGHQPAFAGINTFMKAPYCEDIRKIGNFEAAFVGAPFELGHHLPSGNAVRTAGGAAHLRALRRLLVRRRRRHFRGARSLRCRRHLRHSRQYREDFRPGDQGRLAYLHFGRLPRHLRRRPQSRLPQCARDRAAYRRQCRHHPYRPPYRYPGEGYG